MTSPEWSFHGQAVLFDLDGTLVDSGASVLRAWTWIADELGIAFSRFVPYLHGIPADEVLATVVPELSRAEARAWALRLNERQAEDVEDVWAIPGAEVLLDALPTSRWAVVTSGDLRLASARIAAAGLPRPRVLVTADDVDAGKPSPQPFLLGAANLDARPTRCLVVEDSPAGVRSGLAAGMTVLGILTSSPGLDGAAHEVTDLTGCAIDADRLGLRFTVRTSS